MNEEIEFFQILDNTKLGFIWNGFPSPFSLPFSFVLSSSTSSFYLFSLFSLSLFSFVVFTAQFSLNGVKFEYLDRSEWYRLCESFFFFFPLFYILLYSSIYY